MASPSITLADALVTELNAGSWSLAFTATREYRPAKTTTELDTLRVTVVPAEQFDLLATRAQSERELICDIGIQKKVAAMTNALLDPLMSLVEEIIVFLKTNSLAAYSTAKWILTENAPIYDPTHLQEALVFTSVVRVHYKVHL